MASNRSAKLARDSVLFFISGFGSKLLVFLLVPFYTAVLSEEEYGIADLITVTTTLLIPVFSFCVSDAVLRFAFDKQFDRYHLLSFASTVLLLSTLLVACVYPIVVIISKSFARYWYLLVLFYFSSSCSNTIYNLSKADGDTKLVAVVGIIQTTVLIGSNLLLLLVFKMGVVGYMTSLIASELLASLTILCKRGYWGYLKLFHFNKNDIHQILLYSIPLIPTVVFWWINSSADRYMITAFIGPAAVGLYSVAHKIPSILSNVSHIFMNAWQLTAISSYEDTDYGAFFSRIYRIVNISFVLLCLLLILSSKTIGSILFSKSFFQAWIYVPFLVIGALFSTLSGCLNSAFIASKKTKLLFISTLAGTVINLILNFILIPRFGIQGAGFSTMLSFWVVQLTRVYTIKRVITIKLSIIKDIVCHLLLFVMAIMTIKEWLLLSIIVSVIIMIVYFKDINELLSILRVKGHLLLCRIRR